MKSKQAVLRMPSCRSKARGFTLLEVLTVVAIIALLAAGLVFFLSVEILSTQSTGDDASGKKILLPGMWLKHGFAYHFEDDGTVTALNLGAPPSQIRSPYSWITMGSHSCIAFRKNPADSLSIEVLLVGEMTDSTAVLALGTPFVRAAGGIVGELEQVEVVFGVVHDEQRGLFVRADLGSRIGHHT